MFLEHDDNEQLVDEWYQRLNKEITVSFLSQFVIGKLYKVKRSNLIPYYTEMVRLEN